MTVNPADHITSQIVERIRESLSPVLWDNIDPTDPTRCVVKIGRFQEDPSPVVNYIAIQMGDLEDPNYLDGISSLRKDEHQIGWNVPSREIGGTEMWWRRGTIRIGCFFIVKNYDETTARQSAGVIMGRVEGTLPRVSVANLRDPYGEHAIKLFVEGNTFFQSGGPPSSYIWRGKVRYQVLTERN